MDSSDSEFEFSEKKKTKKKKIRHTTKDEASSHSPFIIQINKSDLDLKSLDSYEKM